MVQELSESTVFKFEFQKKFLRIAILPIFQLLQEIQISQVEKLCQNFVIKLMAYLRSVNSCTLRDKRSSIRSLIFVSKGYI